jgi:LysR family transcriptional regulator, hydrogen peroxide-inducible genes activator
MGRPTLQQLTYFVALADEGHFGRAADECHVSQPALSSQIRELESRLGTPLVERLPKGIRLTPEGVEVLARARRVLNDVEELIDAVGRESSHLSGPLFVGAIPTVAPYILSDFVSTVMKRHPAAVLRFEELTTDELLDALRAGRLDLVLCALPVEGADLIKRPILDDEFLLATSTSHPLAGGTGTVPTAILTELSVLLLREGHCLRDQALAVCATVQSATTDLRATSLPTLVQMVAADAGVTLLPTTAASVEARPGNGIAIRRFDEPPQRTLALVWRASNPRGVVYDEIATLLASALERFASPPPH